MKLNPRISGLLFSALALNLFFVNFISAQSINLVENPGFEDYTSPAICTWSGLMKPGQEILAGWVTPTKGSPDFYNSKYSVCGGYSIAKAQNGEGRVALTLGLGEQNPPTTNYKEYVQGKLMEPLITGQKYCVKFYVALDHASPYTTSGIGAYISSDPIRSDDKERLSYQPQIISHQLITSEDGWVLISGTYTAKGGEKFITLGSFSDTSVVPLFLLGKSPQNAASSEHIMRAAYFYMDDVSVMQYDQTTDCTTKKLKKSPGDDFIFLLDFSGSMNKNKKIYQLKKQIKLFTKDLNKNDRIAIMTCSGNAKFIVPFSSLSDSAFIDLAIDNLKSCKLSNGDLAMQKINEIIDSIHSPQHCHVIIATDGIINVTEKTKNELDSVFNNNKTSCCVLQFGNITNYDLQEITVRTPHATFNYATKHNIPKIMKAQLATAAPAENTVFYTDMTKISKN